MENELRAILYKEVCEIARENGSSKGSLLRLAMLAALGVASGWQSGLTLATGPLLPLFGALIGFTVTIPSVADSFAGERERHTLESLFATPLSDVALVVGKLAACVAVALIAVPIFISLAVVAAASKSGGAVLRQTGLASVTIGSFVLAMIAALLVGAVGLQVSLRAATVRNALQGITLGILALVGIPRVAIGLTGWSPSAFLGTVGERFGIEAVVALVLAVLLVVIIAGVAIDVRTCRRVRLQGGN